MHVDERPPAAPGRTLMSADDLEIVLEPLARPEFGALRIDGSLFAVGRTEPPFTACGADVLAMLSRRHARIFCEDGAVYVADLDSRNGTTLNRARIDQTPCRLRDGDEIGFGGVLSYRVRIAPRAANALGGAPHFRLSLTPAAGDTTLQPIVVTRFPFLVGKGDALFALDADGRQLSFLSRRHAHIFRKDGGAWVEDLASTNGTFVDGIRLQEHAVRLEDGVLLAFGGEHFTYRVGISADVADAVAQPSANPAREPRVPTPDKTTFVAAPTSFLDIFCTDEEPDPGIETQSAALPAAPEKASPRRRSRGHRAVLFSEVAALFASTDPVRARRNGWKAAALVAIGVAAALIPYFRGAPERDLKDALDRGAYAEAAALADRALERRPDDAELKSIGTQAALRAHVPTWLATLQTRDFDGAVAALDALSALGTRNPELPPLVAELQWLGDLERYTGERGGAEAPIRIYADEDRVTALIRRWNTNTGEHQRLLARIASHVPQFSAPYAEALTHLRRLQSDASVVLAAIERLKAIIAAALNRDDLPALQAELKDAAVKYPGLGGLDDLRRDLALYVAIANEARSRKSGRLFALLQAASFTTPPFQQAFRTLLASRQLPAAPLVASYAAATQAWQGGRVGESLDALQTMRSGPWADAIGNEIQRRQDVTARYAHLQTSRAASGYADELLDFRAALDPDQDSHWMRATQADLALQRDKVLARAQDAMLRARSLWQDYRDRGAIEASQRVETAISPSFRARAGLLADADHRAQQAVRIYAQVDAPVPEPWLALHDEISTEAEQQRDALQTLRNVLEPQVLKSKLALLGEPNP